MSDSKERYSINAKNYITKTVPGSSLDQERYMRSKLRESKHNEEWCKHKVDLNEIVAKFIPEGAKATKEKTESGVKYVYVGDRYIIKCDKVSGYLRIYDKKTRKYCTADGIPSQDQAKTHFKIKRREEM